MDLTRARRDVACAVGVVTLIGLALPSLARAEVPCAGDGPPIYEGVEGYLPASVKALVPTALVSLGATPWSGSRAALTNGDPSWPSGASVPGPFGVERARLGLCGADGRWAYRLVWEPWSRVERAQPDAASAGRLVDAQVALAPWSWLVLSVGIQKTPAGRGREQPEGALALPLRPFSTELLAPDRRLGLSGQVDAGVGRIAVGVYEAARTFDLAHLASFAGLLAVARAELVPWGPIGARPDAEVEGHPRWSERPRFTTGLVGAYRWTPQGDALLLGADAAFAWRRLFLGAEFLYADRWPVERPMLVPGVLRRALGGWLEANVRLLAPWLAAAARVEYVDEDLRLDTPGRYLAGSLAATVELPGPLARLQLMYTRRLHLVGPIDAADDALYLLLTVEK